jgi:pimeloyl-ACP methyl ester carboxylesterase
VIVVHGGPGAAGSMAPVARALAHSSRVIEPFQRVSSHSVADHVADLREIVESRCAGVRPALVGHSWGAMLALAYAAAHPVAAGPLVLVGCGTFDLAARDRMRAILDARMDEALRHRFEHLEKEFPDPNQRLREISRLTLPLYSCDLISTDQEIEVPDAAADARANHEAWQDIVRLQNEGVYPAAFAAIKTAVLMLHGVDDPHPGRMIRASLEPFLPQLEYREIERCGHYPWLEKAAHEEFFTALREWLARHTF